MTKIRNALYTTFNQRLIDAGIAGFAFWLAYQLRFAWQVPSDSVHQFWFLLPWVMLGSVFLNFILGLYRIVWRYIGLTDAMIVARSYILFSLFLLVLRFGLPSGLATFRVPVSIIIMEFMLSLGGAISVRSLRRIVYEGFPAKLFNGNHMRRVLLIGAGQAGAMLAKEIAARSDIKPVGFLDDDPGKRGLRINGLSVLGPLDALASTITGLGVEEVIICIAKVPRATLKRIWAVCESFPVRTKIVPTLEEILQGKTSIAAFRDVELNDLLGRESLPSSLDDPVLCETYHGKRILITGGGGSIGSELAYQLSKLGPAKLILLDKDENGLHDACLRLQDFPDVCPVVADLRFPARLKSVFSLFRPEVVFHAAAHKHVYLMEMNPGEAILNNIVGTSNLLDACKNFGASRFVLISTDKAVKPTSIMGASKRLCEMIVQTRHANGNGSGPTTRFCCVRFGNVIGSRGSVVPIFQKQIAHGGPVTVTHPNAERYLMTIPEAVNLLIQAGALGSAGEIFVLDMGEPVLIQNLARGLIELSGLQPDKDVAIKITQLQQGEKLSEELLDQEREFRVPTRVARVGVVQGQLFDSKTFFRELELLKDAAQRDAASDIWQVLEGMKIGFQPPKTDISAEVQAKQSLASAGKSNGRAAAARAGVSGAMANDALRESESSQEWGDATSVATLYETEVDHA